MRRYNLPSLDLNSVCTLQNICDNDNKQLYTSYKRKYSMVIKFLKANFICCMAVNCSDIHKPSWKIVNIERHNRNMNIGEESHYFIMTR
jgi:hypothetical protein